MSARLFATPYKSRPAVLTLLHDSRSNDYSVMVRSIALVALSDIKDEELLLNYRLNPALDAPAWYTQVDPEEDERRWS